MTYATQQTLIDRYGERMLVALTDRGAVATGLIDTDTVDRALIDADAMIDGYLAGRYVLPLAETPPLVQDIAAKLAIWNLHTSSGDPKLEADHAEAMRALRDISAGRLRLGVAGVEPAASGGSSARSTDRDRPFTAQTLKGFI